MLWNAGKFGNENDVVRWYAAHRMNYMLKKGGVGGWGEISVINNNDETGKISLY